MCNKSININYQDERWTGTLPFAERRPKEKHFVSPFPGASASAHPV